MQMLTITVCIILAGLLISMLWFATKDVGESQDNQLKPEEIIDAGLLLARMWMDLALYSELDTKNYKIHLQNNIRSLRKLIIQIYEAHNKSIELSLNDEREAEDDKKQPQDQVITAVNKLLSDFSSFQELSRLYAAICFERMDISKNSIIQLNDEIRAKPKELDSLTGPDRFFPFLFAGHYKDDQKAKRTEVV